MSVSDRSGLKSAAAAGLGVSPQGPLAPAAVVVVLPPLSGLLLLPHAVTPTAIATATPMTANLRMR